LRVNPDGSCIVIRGLGTESRYFEIPDDRIGEIVAFFPAEGDSPEKLKTFVSAIEG
jgi:hypothetical protein